MVTTLMLCVTLIAIVCLICFKGFTITYKKTFTVDDKRVSTNFPLDRLEELEAKLNKKLNQSNEQTLPNDDDETPTGPMDAVIAEIQDLFGPGSTYKDDKNRR